MEATYMVRHYKNRRPHYSEIKLHIETTTTNQLEIIENYSGKGFYSQGYMEIIPAKGYDLWKTGIHNGITYAYSKLKQKTGLKVTIVEAGGFSTDTNAIILGFVAARAILNNIENKETAAEFQLTENLMNTSWDYGFYGIPDFENQTIIADSPAIPSRISESPSVSRISESLTTPPKRTAISRFWEKLKK